MKNCLLIAVALAVGSPAYAFNWGIPDVIGPACFPPNLARCQSVAYQTSQCGRRNRRRCSSILINAAADQTQNLPVGEMLNDEGDLISTREISPEATNIRVSGFEGAFGGQLLKQQRESNTRRLPRWFTPSHRADRQRWARNGVRVESCDEYVYERWYDYNVFEDQMASLGTDWWGIYDAAHAARGIVNTVPRSKDRHHAFLLPGLTGTLSRNAFAMVRLDTMQAFNEVLADGDFGDIEIFNFDPDLIAATRAARRGAVPNTWANHRARAEALRAVDAHTLVALTEAAGRFAKLVRRQEAATQAIHDADAAITVAEGMCRINRQRCNTIDARVQDLTDAINALADVNREVQAALREGQAMGCVEDEDIGLCDWSPRDFVALLEGKFLNQREADYDRCMLNTADDFSAMANAGNFRRAYCHQDPRRYYCRHANAWPARNDFRGGTQWVDRYFSRLETFVANFPMSTNPATGAPRLAESAQDSGENGDSRFGIDFEYDLGWAVDDLGDGQNYCETDIAVQATVTANVTAFGYSTSDVGRDMFQATLALVADDEPRDGRQRVAVETDISVFGQSFSQTNTRLDQINIVRNPRRSASTPHARMDVPIAGIPLYLEGWVTGEAGADVSVVSHGERDCDDGHIDIGIDALLKPFVTVDAHANAGLDFFIVEAGVGVDVTLLDLQMPFTADVGLEWSPQRAELTASANLDLTLSTLAGRIRVFIEPFIGDGWSKVIFDWKGISKSYTMFGTEYVLPFDALTAALSGV